MTVKNVPKELIRR